VKELGVRMPWRKTGAARRLHVSLLAEYVNEPYVTPMANLAPVLPVMIHPTLRRSSLA
jgi:hypothetical protein